MRPFLRLAAVVLALAVLVGLPFAIWGDRAWIAFSGEAAGEWIRGFGAWGWAAAVGLIASDVVLPVPSTAVMVALGIVYGPWLGGLIGAAGSFLAGCIGYWLCRALGPETARRLAGAKGLEAASRLLERWGVWLVAASRWLPVLPETVSFLAGLARMPFGRFAAALAAGVVPLGFTFATVGYLGADYPVLTIVVAAILPLGLVFVVGYLRRR